MAEAKLYRRSKLNKKKTSQGTEHVRQAKRKNDLGFCLPNFSKESLLDIWPIFYVNFRAVLNNTLTILFLNFETN